MQGAEEETRRMKKQEIAADFDRFRQKDVVEYGKIRKRDSNYARI